MLQTAMSEGDIFNLVANAQEFQQIKVSFSSMIVYLAAEKP